MKKLLLITASLLTMTCSNAYADNLPKEFFGKWCREPDDTPRKPGAEWHDTYNHGVKCEMDSEITIKQNGYSGWEFGCTFTSVRIKFDPSIVAATKTPMGVNVAHINAKCGGEGCTNRSKFTIYVSKGTMYMRGTNTKARCDG
jgi:hypothetical protein